MKVGLASSERSKQMIYRTIVEEQDHMIAGTLPERFKDIKKSVKERYNAFDKDFWENLTATMEFLAAMNQERKRKEGISKTERQTVV